MASPACALPVSRGSPVARSCCCCSSLRRSRRLRRHWRLSRARLAPRGAPEYISQSDAADCDTTPHSRALAPARLMHPGARRGASRAGMPPTASQALRAAGEEQQRQCLATKERRHTVRHAPEMRLAGERIAARKDASTWLAQSESSEGDLRLVTVDVLARHGRWLFLRAERQVVREERQHLLLCRRGRGLPSHKRSSENHA